MLQNSDREALPAGDCAALATRDREAFPLGDCIQCSPRFLLKGKSERMEGRSRSILNGRSLLHSLFSRLYHFANVLSCYIIYRFVVYWCASNPL
ncbi:hypothetical protein FIV49_05090 [Cylindrospermopsis raciborskii GIHE 2018]|nr:hypothetical protein FIV49_05090 [Cylindrospermopsis raciborskii GIHE 2018]